MKKRVSFLFMVVCFLFALNLSVYAKESTKVMQESGVEKQTSSCNHTKKLTSWHIKLVKYIGSSSGELICPTCDSYTYSNDEYPVYENVTIDGKTYNQLCYIPAENVVYLAGDNLTLDTDATFYVTVVDSNDNAEDIYSTSLETGYNWRLYKAIPSKYVSEAYVGKTIRLFCYTWLNGENLDKDKMAGINYMVVDSPINIIQDPVSRKVNKGGDVTFACDATGTNLKYQWYYNDYDSTYDGVAITGATNSTLTLYDVPASYNGRYYYCKVSNYSSTTGYAKVTKTTDTAKLTVSSPYTYTKKGTISSLKSTKKGVIVLKFKKVSGCSGMKVDISYQKSFNDKKTLTLTKSSKDYKNGSMKGTKLKSKKTVYVKIRPYIKKSGKTYYGKWSSVKKVKVK